MTFTELVQSVAKRTNLTSETALDRIGEEINERYKWMATSIGFNTVARRVAKASTTQDSRYLTFGPGPQILGVQKVLSVFNAGYNPPLVLGEITFDQMRNQVPGTDPAQQYAFAEMGAKSVTIWLDANPGSVYELSADVLASVATLQGDDEPAFSENFHDILFYGAMAAEYDRMEKPTQASKKEKQFEDRLAELRLFIAKSAYLNIYQNRTGLGNTSVPLVQS